MKVSFNKKNKIILIATTSIIFISLISIYLFVNRLNEEKLQELTDELNENSELSDVFPINFIEDEFSEVVEYKDYKVYDYKIVGSGDSNFAELNDEEKLNILNEIAETTKHKLGNSPLMECGKNKFCNITEITVFEPYNKDKALGAVSIEFDDDKSLAEYTMEVVYDDNGKRGTRTYSSKQTASKPANTTPSTTENPTKILELEETSCVKERNYMYAKGYVKNNSDLSLSYIEVKADFLDESGNIVDTDYTYAVGSEGLSPDGRKSFDIMTPLNESVTQCKYYIVDYK